MTHSAKVKKLMISLSGADSVAFSKDPPPGPPSPFLHPVPRSLSCFQNSGTRLPVFNAVELISIFVAGTPQVNKMSNKKKKTKKKKILSVSLSVCLSLLIASGQSCSLVISGQSCSLIVSGPSSVLIVSRPVQRCS